MMVNTKNRIERKTLFRIIKGIRAEALKKGAADTEKMMILNEEYVSLINNFKANLTERREKCIRDCVEGYRNMFRTYKLGAC